MTQRNEDRPSPSRFEGVPVVQLKSASYGTYIYQRMIGPVTGRPADGDIVAVLDKYGRFFGWGFYNGRAQIALRMFSHDERSPLTRGTGVSPAARERTVGTAANSAAVAPESGGMGKMPMRHTGKMPVPRLEPFLAQRVARAVAFRRDALGLDRTTDAYRLIHAEGDGLSGLVADRFGGYVVIELFSLAMNRRLEGLEDALVDAGVSVRNFVVRLDKAASEEEGFHLGRLDDNKNRQTTITENGVQFRVELSKGHKTGFFCDQRENRLAHTAFTPGKSVLDVCCYTGGFSCYAAKLGRAAGVTAVDLDEAALAVAKENAALNGAAIDFIHGDAFDYLRSVGRQRRQWDVVVVDPSKFVPHRTVVETGLRKYGDLNRLAAAVVKPGGVLLTCSCSGLVDQATFVGIVARAARAAGRELQVFRITGAGPDHPFMADTPEGQYLKAVWARVE